PLFLNLAVEIASAIEEIHSQGVIHKDINPANIIASPTLDAVKLIDFELATRTSEEIVGFEPPDVLEGTFLYMSPEQTGRVNKPVDSRTDLYSMGATFYRLITGKPPFDSPGPGELIYAHIAKTPTPVIDIRQDVPGAVSLVIEKLMEKSPDERYQTAGGVKRDLLYLRKAALEGKKIIDFKPGRNEHAGRIVLSGKLYGREKETASLLDSFRKCSDIGRVVAVTGPGGIGKTALIRELYAPITARKGFFLSGKFDQLDNDPAYTALADAMKDFVRQGSGRDMESMEVWRTAVQSSVGEFGQVLTDIVPEFENLIGKQPAIAPVSPLETVARRNSVFSNLVEDICAVGRPLVLFLDDLQWADSATLSLLETIIRKNPKNLLIILSYRDNEISPAHPVKRLMDSVHACGIALSAIHPGSLDEGAVNDWMNDILPDAGQTARELAALVMAKTEGNPYYVTSLLHLMIDKNYIERKPD
ncbi:MAG: AAA family ATPase, partial [Desulfobacterales bacterium]|nr:AAA family ATPase [Desulfobacterales bacterium]